MIVCPACGSATSVRETRSHGNYYRRRRVCDNTQCGHRVTTIEAVVDEAPRGDDVAVISRADLEAISNLVGRALGKPDE